MEQSRGMMLQRVACTLAKRGHTILLSRDLGLIYSPRILFRSERESKRWIEKDGVLKDGRRMEQRDCKGDGGTDVLWRWAVVWRTVLLLGWLDTVLFRLFLFLYFTDHEHEEKDKKITGANIRTEANQSSNGPMRIDRNLSSPF